MFSVHTTPEEFENATITGHFGCVFEDVYLDRESHDYRDVTVFEKLRFQNVFRPHENEKPAFSNSSGLKSVFEKFRFRGGIVWTVSLAVETKLGFQIFPAW